MSLSEIHFQKRRVLASLLLSKALCGAEFQIIDESGIHSYILALVRGEIDKFALVFGDSDTILRQVICLLLYTRMRIRSPKLVSFMSINDMACLLARIPPCATSAAALFAECDPSRDAKLKLAHGIGEYFTSLTALTSQIPGQVSHGVYSALCELQTLVQTHIDVYWGHRSDLLSGEVVQNSPPSVLQFLTGLIERRLFVNFALDGRNNPVVKSCLKEVGRTLLEIESKLKFDNECFMLWNPNLDLESLLIDDTGDVHGTVDWRNSIFLPHFAAIPKAFYDLADGYGEQKLGNLFVCELFKNLKTSYLEYLSGPFRMLRDITMQLVNGPETFRAADIELWLTSLYSICDKWSVFRKRYHYTSWDVDDLEPTLRRRTTVQTVNAHTIHNFIMARFASASATSVRWLSSRLPFRTLLVRSGSGDELFVLRLAVKPVPHALDMRIQEFIQNTSLSYLCPKVMDFSHVKGNLFSASFTFCALPEGQLLSDVWESLPFDAKTLICQDLGSIVRSMQGLKSEMGCLPLSSCMHLFVHYDQYPEYDEDFNGSKITRNTQTAFEFIEFQIKRWQRLSYIANNSQHYDLEGVLSIAKFLQKTGVFESQAFSLFYPHLDMDHIIVRNDKVSGLIGLEESFFAPSVLQSIPSWITCDPVLLSAFELGAGVELGQPRDTEDELARFVVAVAVNGVQYPLDDTSVRSALKRYEELCRQDMKSSSVN